MVERVSVRLNAEHLIIVCHFRVSLYLCVKASPLVNLSFENAVDLHENEPVGGTIFK